MNEVYLEIKDDKYKLFINGTELENITSLYVDKQSIEMTNITVSFNCKLETKTAFPKCKEIQSNEIHTDKIDITPQGIEVHK